MFQIVQNGGELWLTTNRGLLKYSPGNGPQSNLDKFTSDDGLLANIFNANSGIKSSTGHIYIGCNNGINKFYPYDFTRRENSAKLSVVFPDFRASSTAACPWTDDCCPIPSTASARCACADGRCRSALISLRSTSPRR